MVVDVSVIIINYNTKSLLRECIHSIYQHTSNISFEIIVVDNASIDGSREMIKSEFLNVILICSERNLGFGVANNLAMEAAVGKHYFFLNSDTLFLNNALDFFLKYFQTNPAEKIGCLGTYLLDSQLEVDGYGSLFPSNYLFVKNLMQSFFRKIGFASNEQKITQLAHVDYVLGAAMFIPKEVINTIGNFDPIYFMYYEEADLQLRMRDFGFKRKIIDGPRIIHLEGKSFNIKFNKLLIVKKSSFLYFNKNKSPLGYLAFRVLSLVECIIIFANFKSSFSFGQKMKYLKFNLSSIKKINESRTVG